MPRYKVLKGVAHNIGHSFTSLMNYSVDDYSMGYILRFARETGLDTLTIDFVTGEGKPPLLLGKPISKVPTWYTEMFWDMVARSGSDRSLVQSATLTLKYDLPKSQLNPVSGILLTPYVCDVTILDNRGKHYSAHFEDVWYVERGSFIAPVRRWWNPFRWFRK